MLGSVGNPSPTFSVKSRESFPSVWELAKAKSVVDYDLREEKWTEYPEFEGDED